MSVRCPVSRRERFVICSIPVLWRASRFKTLSGYRRGRPGLISSRAKIGASIARIFTICCFSRWFMHCGADSKPTTSPSRRRTRVLFGRRCIVMVRRYGVGKPTRGSSWSRKGSPADPCSLDFRNGRASNSSVMSSRRLRGFTKATVLVAPADRTLRMEQGSGLPTSK